MTKALGKPYKFKRKHTHSGKPNPCLTCRAKHFHTALLETIEELESGDQCCDDCHTFNICKHKVLATLLRISAGVDDECV